VRGRIRPGLGGYTDLTLWRLNNDGTPDATFGAGGVVHGPAGEAMALLGATDGTFLVLYVSSQEVVVTRYGANGELMGPVPEESVDVWHDRVSSLGKSAAIDSTGGVVVTDGGFGMMGAAGPQPTLRRFDAYGTADARFAPPQIPEFDPSAPRDNIATGRDIVVDSTGRILVVGAMVVDGSFSAGVTVWRFNPDGSRDPTFGQDGVVVLDDAAVESVERALSIAIDGDGRIVLTGVLLSGSNSAMTIWCMTPEGYPDASFGENGRVVSSVPGPQDSESNGAIVRIDSESRIVVHGVVGDRTGAVWRYLPDGSPDESFGENGNVAPETYIPAALRRRRIVPMSIAVDSSGRIVVAGTTAREPAADVLLWRLSTDGTLDRSFGVDGFLLYDRRRGFYGLTDGPLGQ
jgi:uncharacterized delta-60 repeat protein